MAVTPLVTKVSLPALALALILVAAPATPTIQGRSDHPLGKGAGGPVAIAVADLNGDGWPDAATSNSASGNISVLLGGPGGSFTGAPGSPIPSFGSPVRVRTTDMNADGKPDLVVLDGGRLEVAVLLGDGTGRFAAAPGSPHFVGARCLDLFLGDFNGDGRPDVAVSGSSWFDPSYLGHQADVLLGMGGGNLVRSLHAPVRAGLIVAVGDLDRDGLSDLVVVRGTALAVLRGRPDGSFLEVPPVGVLPVDVFPVACIADVNEDGIPDVVVGDDSSLRVFSGLGDGTLAPGVPIFDRQIDSVVVADFDGDGHVDVAADSSGILEMIWDVGTAARTRTEQIGYGSALAVVDLDRDGFLDLLGTGNVNAVAWLRGGGARLPFTARMTYLGSSLSGATLSVDLDHDGIPEIVASGASGLGSRLQVLRRGPSGYADADGSPYSFDRIRTFTTADVNGDGEIDLVVAEAVLYTFNSWIKVLFGNGTGRFSPATGPSSVLPDHGYHGDALSVGRANGDAFTLLVTWNTDLWIGDRTGTFALAPGVTLPSGRKLLVDLNGDGFLDVIGLGFVLLGDGTGHFGPRLLGPTEYDPKWWGVGDLDGDGHPDFVLLGSSWRVISRYFGDGAGGFGPRLTFSVDGGASLLALGDLDQDGRLDLVAATGDRLETYLTTADRALRPGPSYALRRTPSSLAVGDLDADGVPDILAVSREASLVSLFTSAPAPVLDPGPLPAARVGLAYRHTVGATGGTLPYVFSGYLDGWLGVSADGSIRGRAPRYPWTSDTFLSVTDATGRTGFRQVTYSVEPARFFTLTPCRLVDTRPDRSLPAQGRRRLSAAGCSLPDGASLIAANVTVTGASAPGYFTLFPPDIPRPAVSTLNFGAGQTRANNALLLLDSDGMFNVENAAAGDDHLIVDVSGYFD